MSFRRWFGVVVVAMRDVQRAIEFYTRQCGIECTPNAVHDTPWKTREFALYDPDRNALTFYRHLTRSEQHASG